MELMSDGLCDGEVWGNGGDGGGCGGDGGSLRIGIGKRRRGI